MVDKRIMKYFDEIVSDALDSVQMDYDYIFEILLSTNPPISPIEILLYLALHHKTQSSFGGPDQLNFEHQKRIGPYRVDFLVSWSGIYRDGPVDSASVVVECDGHDFHEKTKEQAESDRKREREILTAGFPVLRFTGREIWRDPSNCVDQIVKFLHEQLRIRYRFREANAQP